jgi:cytochrome c553
MKKTLCVVMLIFAVSMSDEDIVAIAAYVGSLAPGK